MPRKQSGRRLEAFWKKTSEELRKRGGQRYNNHSPSDRNYLNLNFTTGVSKCGYRLHIVKKVATVDLYLERDYSKDDEINENKRIFDQLKEKEREIEKRFGTELTWRREDRYKHSKIRYSQPFNVYNEENWPEVIEWLCENLIKLERAFEEPLDLLGQELESRGTVSEDDP